jgi:hypothetical protein
MGCDFVNVRILTGHGTQITENTLYIDSRNFLVRTHLDIFGMVHSFS